MWLELAKLKVQCIWVDLSRRNQSDGNKVRYSNSRAVLISIYKCTASIDLSINSYVLMTSTPSHIDVFLDVYI